MKHHITIDYEEWYHGLTSTSRQHDKWPEFEDRIIAQTDWLLNALKTHNVKASFYILGVVAREHPDLIAKIVQEGHEIGLHGDLHKPVSKMDRQTFHDDLKHNWDAVTAASGTKPVGYRAAYASLSDETSWIWDELNDIGIAYDSSIFPIKTPLYGMPSAPRFRYDVTLSNGQKMPEFPISTAQFFGKNMPYSGGFYFRALPYWLIKKSIAKVAKEGHSTIFYFHPWEFDETHPMPDCVTKRERLSHYGFLKNNSEKFLRLLQDYEFEPLENTI